ncbi:hypothetical protein WI71_09930 [Burkholderia diffusa]|nr:hypothetical protein WI71_09930 [Burkholderia diffusa]
MTGGPGAIDRIATCRALALPDTAMILQLHYPCDRGPTRDARIPLVFPLPGPPSRGPHAGRSTGT